MNPYIGLNLDPNKNNKIIYLETGRLGESCIHNMNCTTALFCKFHSVISFRLPSSLFKHSARSFPGALFVGLIRLTNTRDGLISPMTLSVVCILLEIALRLSIK